MYWCSRQRVMGISQHSGPSCTAGLSCQAAEDTVAHDELLKSETCTTGLKSTDGQLTGDAGKVIRKDQTSQGLNQHIHQLALPLFVLESL